MPIAVGWLGAAMISAAVSFLVGALTLRLRANYLAITTFGIAIALQLCFQNVEVLTGGVFGVGFVPRAFGDVQSNALLFNYANLALAATLVVALYLLLEHLASSPWGRAMREDETAAQSLGKNPAALRL